MRCNLSTSNIKYRISNVGYQKERYMNGLLPFDCAQGRKGVGEKRRVNSENAEAGVPSVSLRAGRVSGRSALS